MLDTDLSDLYQLYHLLKYYGKYSIPEVDNMYPYEREIYWDLLLSTVNKQNQQNGE